MGDEPNDPIEPTPPPPSGTARDLQTEFEGGKARLHAEKEVGIKRGRGRPPKKKPDPEVPIAPPAPTPSFKAVLIPACQVPFQYLAARTGFAGFEVTAAEVEPAANCFDDLCKIVFPQIASGPWALAISGVLCLGMIFLGKMPEFQKWQRAEFERNQTPPAVTPVAS